jgi:hypothetical protein
MTIKLEYIMSAFSDFTSGIRALMLIDRGESNTNKGSRRWINKLVSTNEIQFKSNLKKLLELQYYMNNPDVRLYSCVNPRKLDQSIKNFHHKLVDLYTVQDKISFICRVNDKFCSSLMQPENKDSNLFLLDFDTKDFNDNANLIARMATLHINIIYSYPTPNGWHYVTDPFNPILLTGVDDLQIKKDALLLLNTIENKQNDNQS